MKNVAELKAGNPFYGEKELLHINSLSGSKNIREIKQTLQSVWNVAKLDRTKRQLFHTICFNIGSITNRQHNIYGNHKVDDGGESSNEFWLEYLNFLLDNDQDQFIKFIPIIIQFVGDRELANYQVRTKKGSKDISGTSGLLKKMQSIPKVWNAYIEVKAADVASSNPFTRHQTAKFMHIPRYSSRQKVNRKTGEKDGRRALQGATVDKMRCYEKFVTDMSAKCGWEIKTDDKNKVKNFIGFKKFKRQYQDDMVDYLFSTKTVLSKDETQFKDLLNKLPSGARDKVKLLIKTADNKIKKPEYANLVKWFLEWDDFKKQKQQEVRDMTEKGRETTLSDEEMAALEKLKKQAKVTTGANTLFTEIESLIKAGGAGSDTQLESIFNKINFGVSCRVIVDYSGSMNGRPKLMGALAAAVALLKREKGIDTFFGFSSTFTAYNAGMKIESRDRWGSKTIEKRVEFSRKKSLYENFKLIYEAYMSGNAASTDISCVSRGLKEWVESASTEAEKEMRREDILDCPILLLISDGDLNSEDNANSSMAKFKMELKQWFNYEPVIVVWNVPGHGEQGRNKSRMFENLENVMFVETYNPSTINQIFTKIGDFDVIDIYTPLKSLYENTRYELVRQNTI